MRSPSKTMTLWALLIVLAVLFFQMYERQASNLVRDFNYDKFVKAVVAGKIAKDSIVIRKNAGEI